MLNVRSKFEEEELEMVRQRKVNDTLGSVPTSQGVVKTLGQLKNGKAAGSSGMLPEMLKEGRKDSEFVGMLEELVRSAWEERCVPQEWVNATLVPIPKKGNLHCCDSWRGIALLDVVGKVVMARIIQGMLQRLVEKELLESQHGFRRGQGCTDVIFTVRQLAEKAIEHQEKQYLIFVKLRKAYMILSHARSFG